MDGDAAAAERVLSYVDTDGTTMEWDADKKAYFPKFDEQFMLEYQLNYGQQPSKWTAHQNEEGHTYYFNSTTNESVWEKPADYVELVTAIPDPVAEASVKAVAVAAEKKKEKETKKRKSDKTDPTFFQIAEDQNPNVYVTGLPEDLTDEEFIAFMSKCGILAQDDRGAPKVKLYRTADGGLKGDARCCYLKVDSVPLALQLLDQSEIKPGHAVTITRAVFQQKGDFDASKKPRKPKKKKGKDHGTEKLLSWHEPTAEKKKKAEGVVVLKHMFAPKQFDEDPTYLNDLREDLQSECEKFGAVKKIMIFDRHPEGVVSVRFETVESQLQCIKSMHGRFFAGQALSAEPWDGHTSYKIEESDMERDERLKGWEDYLEKGGPANTTAVPGSAVPGASALPAEASSEEEDEDAAA